MLEKGQNYSQLLILPIFAILLVLTGCSDQAEEGAAVKNESPPDISGYWMITFDTIPPLREPDADEKAMLDGLAANAILLGDSGLPEFPPGEYGGLAMHQSAIDEARDFDPEQLRTVSMTCKPPSLIYAMQGPFGVEIFQSPELIAMRMEYYDATRLIFMNETSHPTDWPDTTMGHSIGHWEGETLVVDTVGLTPSTLFNNGVNHSNQIRVHERFHLSSDKSILLLTQEFEDPLVFDGRAARLIPLVGADDHVYPYDCDPAYGIAIENRRMEE